MPFAVPPVDTIRKPIFTPGMKVNWEHPLNRELLCHFPLTEGFGPPQDIVRNLVPTAALTTIDWAATPIGIGLRFNAANERYVVTAPGYLKILPPLSIAVRLIYIGTPSAYSGVFGINYKAAPAAPWNAYCLNADINGKPQLSVNDGTSSINSGYFQDVWTFYPFYFVTTIPTTTTQFVYTNGQNPLTAFTINMGTGPKYDATSQLYLGEQNPSDNRTSNIVLVDAKIWGRALSAAEARQEIWNPYGTPNNPRLI